MEAIIIYFTGTGNTKYLVDKIKTKLDDNSYHTTSFTIDSESKPISLDKYDLIIFSYPIYAFNMPIIFDKYVKTLKFPANKKYLIAKQSGEPLALNNSSSYSLIKRIQKSKGAYLGEYHFLLPYNIHFRYVDNFVKELLRYDYKLLDILIYELNHNIKRKFKKNYLYALNSFIFKIQRLGGPVNSYFYKVNYNKCIHCNKCMNNCPTKSIELVDNKYKFKSTCIMCMRCSFSCPKDAINIGMLQKRKVNGEYNFKEIEKNPYIRGDFLKNHKSFFYNLFPKKLKEIDKKYKEYFKN